MFALARRDDTISRTSAARRPRAERSQAIPAKVFVGNLNFRTSKEKLQELLSQAGTISDIFLPTDRQTGQPRGFAFVEYSNEAEAAEAIRLFNGRELDGRPLKINAADDRPRERTGPRPAPSGPRPAGGGGYRAPRMDFGPPTGEPAFFGMEGREARPKGSRRGVRGRKRSI